MINNKNITALTLATVAMYTLPEVAAYAGGTPFGISLGSNGSFGFSIGGGAGAGGGAAGGIAQALCTIVGWFQGGVGQAIASLAVIFLGISAFFGKATWGTAVMFTVGIFAIFGSADIVQAIVRGTSSGSGFNFSLGSGGISFGRGNTGSCGGF